MDKPNRSSTPKTYEPMTSAQEREEFALARAQLAWGKETTGITARISLVFVSGMTRCAGKFKGSTMQIRLSRDLWMRATPEEREETLYHELSHGVDYVRSGRKWRTGSGSKRLIHDRVFKAIMAELGQKGDRCHKIDRTGLTRRQPVRRRTWAPRPTPVVVRAAAQTSVPAFKVGDIVEFGRNHGEKTRGKVVKINRKKMKVEQTEVRGTRKAHKIGTIWTVPFSLARKVD